jgi:hypothetical protein
MSQFIGRLADIGIAKESSRGVGVAAQYSIPKANFTFNDKSNKARSGESLGHISGNGSQSIVTQRFSEGSIDGEVNINSFGLLLLSTFGSVSTTNPSGAYKHAYTLSNSNQHQSLSVHINDAVEDRIFEGCMVDSLELEINREDVVKFTCGLKGKKGQTSSYTPSYTTADYKFVGRDLTFKVAANTAALSAASALSVKELKLTINKNAEHNFVLGTLEPEDIFNKQITIQGSVTIDFTDTTFRDYMLNGTYRACSIYLNNGRDTIGSNTPQLYLEFPLVDWSEWEVNYENDEIVTQTINFNVLYDVTNSQLISSVYAVNNVSSY